VRRLVSLHADPAQNDREENNSSTNTKTKSDDKTNDKEKKN